ncbi:probable disease resistance protein At5g63020 [Prosopis cineraria]|uniref:probable disease resistance protein At5g63020 n=1 Tax=Prosopis cineraria TaxID=364024 RepID=UPI00240EC733|nr:probable disease resistance protein At5g63020 [Prosopis cineraria]
MDPACIGGAIWDMTKSLCGCLKNEASYVYDLEENLQSLEEKSKKLEDMKKDAEALIEEEELTKGAHGTHKVNTWLQNVDKTQQEIKKIQPLEAQQTQNKCLSRCCSKNCMSSYKRGKNVVKILRNAKNLEDEGEKLFGKDIKITIGVPLRTIKFPSEETVGLDLMLKKVWNSIEDNNVGVIGLHGMGGVGKTTLLKKINNELGKRSSDFYVMGVVVSKRPNLDNIMDNIRKLIGIGETIWQHCSNQDDKVRRIYEILKQKKFFLLLDDIWEKLPLERVGVPHPKETNFQSKVLFTTRFKDVCVKMDSDRKFEVKILIDEEALELFRMKVGVETLNSNSRIPRLAMEMARECKGLPLALTVVGSAMAGVESVEAWEHSKNNLRSSSYTASDLEKKVFSILKFSYDQLPDETHKNCFLYCALYPEDYEIGVHELIDKWIGEGFLDTDSLRNVWEMHGYGGSIIEKLKLSCLLESVEDEMFLQRSIKMHDVIRDMALWIACDEYRSKMKVLVQEDAWVLSQTNAEKGEIVERILIMKNDGSQIQIMPWRNLKTLCLNVGYNLYNNHGAITGLENIQHSSRLRVLELIGVPNVPTEIGGLIHLEYLSLHEVELQKVSEFSSMLKNLKNLKVFNLFITNGAIPLGLISNLQQLKVFCFATKIVGRNNGKEEKELLEELECSSNLEELQMNIETENGINKLLESTKLQNCISRLWIGKYSDLQIKMPLLSDAMSKMKHLQVLYLRGVTNIMEDSTVFGTCCLSMLRDVTIKGCYSIHHLTWLKYAPLLQELDVRHCSSIEEVIKGEGSEEEKDIENVDSIFSSLVLLSLDDLPGLRSIHERVLSFRSLRSITVSACPNLKRLPFDSNSAKAKLRLIGGEPEWWDNLEWDDPTIKATFQSKFKGF